jgi:hypothetical protein
MCITMMAAAAASLLRFLQGMFDVHVPQGQILAAKLCLGNFAGA